jgi:hypothetical protein
MKNNITPLLMTLALVIFLALVLPSCVHVSEPSSRIVKRPVVRILVLGDDGQTVASYAPRDRMVVVDRKDNSLHFVDDTTGRKATIRGSDWTLVFY